MFDVLPTNLAPPKGPVSGAVRCGGMIITAQIPKDSNGNIVVGDIAIQTRQVLENLQTTLAASGGTLRDVGHLFIYLVNTDDAAEMNRIYCEFFKPPYPCRCTVVVKDLLAKNMLVELVAYAHIGP
jgi:2-iminobutanoate/2-iminopropanoate deaminase